MIFILSFIIFPLDLNGNEIIHSYYNRTSLIVSYENLELVKYNRSKEIVERIDLSGHLEQNSGLDYLIFEDNPSLLFDSYKQVKIKRFSDSPTKFLFLSNDQFDFITMYSDQSELINEILSPYYEAGLGVRGSISASSFLIEGDTVYSPDNLVNFDSCKPWVDGVKGNGVGEKISIVTDYSFNMLILSNGFVSYKKPYLYNSNSRIKRFHLYNEEGNIDIEYELQDTPNYQVIELNSETSDLTLEILSIYAGNRWPNDTCLNVFAPFGKKP